MENNFDGKVLIINLFYWSKLYNPHIVDKIKNIINKKEFNYDINIMNYIHNILTV